MPASDAPNTETPWDGPSSEPPGHLGLDALVARAQALAEAAPTRQKFDQNWWTWLEDQPGDESHFIDAFMDSLSQQSETQQSLWLDALALHPTQLMQHMFYGDLSKEEALQGMAQYGAHLRAQQSPFLIWAHQNTFNLLPTPWMFASFSILRRLSLPRMLEALDCAPLLEMQAATFDALKCLEDPSWVMDALAVAPPVFDAEGRWTNQVVLLSLLKGLAQHTRGEAPPPAWLEACCAKLLARSDGGLVAVVWAHHLIQQSAIGRASQALPALVAAFQQAGWSQESLWRIAQRPELQPKRPEKNPAWPFPHVEASPWPWLLLATQLPAEHPQSQPRLWDRYQSLLDAQDEALAQQVFEAGDGSSHWVFDHWALCLTTTPKPSQIWQEAWTALAAQRHRLRHRSSEWGLFAPSQHLLRVGQRACHRLATQGQRAEAQDLWGHLLPAAIQLGLLHEEQPHASLESEVSLLFSVAPLCFEGQLDLALAQAKAWLENNPKLQAQVATQLMENSEVDLDAATRSFQLVGLDLANSLNFVEAWHTEQPRPHPHDDTAFLSWGPLSHPTPETQAWAKPQPPA